MTRFVVACLIVLASAQSALAFGPCQRVMPQDVGYLPSVNACGGRAAIVLSGRYYNAFSVVLRACDNGDRDPCYKNLDSCGTNASSPFKVQTTLNAKVRRSPSGQTFQAKIHCLKETGSSKVYRLVRRLTIKRVNPVVNPSSDVLKICLSSRTLASNPVEIVSVGSARPAGNTGFNRNCLRQKYLGCNLDIIQNTICGG